MFEKIMESLAWGLAAGAAAYIYYKIVDACKDTEKIKKILEKNLDTNSKNK